jgi:hypothetical protein
LYHETQRRRGLAAAKAARYRHRVKITFIGHAALLVEAGGVKILSDPWWQGPCFGDEWWIYPRPCLDAVPDAIDYIYISHGHADHFHRGTLRRFPRGTKALVSSTLDLAEPLREMGFDVVTVGPDEERELGGGMRCRIMPTHNDDTLLALSDGKEVCLNLNDAVHAAPRPIQDAMTSRLKQLYPRIDYVFCGYGIASHFPNCYVIPGKDGPHTVAMRQRYFNNQWAYIVDRLSPRFAFPFAANVVFLNDQLFWANEPTHNLERPTDAFRAAHPSAATQSRDIAPGFVIADGKIVKDVRFAPVMAQDVARIYASEIEKRGARTERTSDGVETLRERLEHNIALARPYLLEYRGDYRFLLVVRDRTWALEIVKSGNAIGVNVVEADTVDRERYNIVFSSYYSYLRRSFTTPYGNETLFVGSGITITYRDRSDAMRNLHREFTPLLAEMNRPPRSRFGNQPRWLHALKSFAKRLRGRLEPDLYDLGAWTRFTSE